MLATTSARQLERKAFVAWFVARAFSCWLRRRVGRPTMQPWSSYTWPLSAWRGISGVDLKHDMQVLWHQPGSEPGSESK